MRAAIAAIVIALGWYFRNELLYIIIAAIFSLIGRPIMKLLRKLRIKGKAAPDGLLAVITLVLLILFFLALFTQIIPVILNIISEISRNFENTTDSSYQLSNIADSLNRLLVSTFPSLGEDFSIEQAVESFFEKQLNPSKMSSIIGGVASGVGNFVIGAFSVVFISFFFIRDDKLFRKIVAAIVPDRHEGKAIAAIGDIEYLLSRYFVGMIVEILGVSLLNFLGLWLIGRLSASVAIGIAFMTGILNVIPYLGPWIGGAIGVVLGTVLKVSAAAAVGASVNIPIVLVVLAAVFVLTQMVDNFFFQPTIYSTSIKASPLEIFIVLILAGHAGGIIGMIAAIPAYTVVRAIAIHFFYNIKAIRRLIPENDIIKEKRDARQIAKRLDE